MTISLVAADEPVEASATNQLIHNVNGSPGRAIFKVDGTWSVPEGVHQFKVTMCGGGGGNSYVDPEDSSPPGSGAGGPSPWASVIFSGYDVGTTFVIQVGAAGENSPNPVVANEGTDGGDTKFGTVFTVTGGGKSSFGFDGSRGSVTFPSGAPHVYHAPVYVNSSGYPYGSAAADGYMVIEW